MKMREVRPGVWKGELWQQGRRRTITHRGTKVSADLFAAKQKIDLSKEDLLNPQISPRFIDFCAEVYKPYAKVHLRKETWKVGRYKLANVAAFLGHLRLTEISTGDVEAYKQKRRATIGAQTKRVTGKSTINGELNALSAVLTYARETLRLPCAKPKIVRFRILKKKGRIKFWSESQVGFILAATASVAPHMFPLVTFLFEVGARKSEAINLQWPKILFEQRIVHIWSESDDDDDDEASEDEEAPLTERAPYEVKSNDREVPLSDHLVKVLRDLKGLNLSDEWVFTPRKRNNEGLKGGPFAYFPKHTWARILGEATRLARIADPEALAIRGGPHKCRHTFASHFLQVKPDLFLLGRILGHTHSRVTELYSHLLPEHLAQARNVVSFAGSAAKANEAVATASNAPVEEDYEEDVEDDSLEESAE